MSSLLGFLFVYLMIRSFAIRSEKRKQQKVAREKYKKHMEKNQKKMQNANKNKNNKKKKIEIEFDKLDEKTKANVKKILDSNNITNDVKKILDSSNLTQADVNKIKKDFKNTYKDIVRGSAIYLDRNRPMRRGENSMEGVSLESTSGNMARSREKDDVFDKFFTRQMQELRDGNDDTIVIGEKQLIDEKITQDDLMRGVVFQEILSKPVSLR